MQLATYVGSQSSPMKHESFLAASAAVPANIAAGLEKLTRRADAAPQKSTCRS